MNYRDWLVEYCRQYPLSSITAKELQDIGVTLNEYFATYWEQCEQSYKEEHAETN